MNGGGMERVMSELANFFCKKDNIKVHLVILSQKKHFYKLNDKINVYEPSFKITGILSVFKLFFYLRTTVSKISPNSVLSFGEMYNSFVLTSLSGMKLKIFISDRSKPDKNWGIIHNNLRIILYKKAYGIISQTNYASEFIQSKIQHKNVVVIGNPFNLVKPKPISTKKNIILTVGRMVKSKQHEHLINIFSLIDNNDWELHFVGDGPERNNLIDLAIKLKIDSRVYFHGFSNDVIKFYETAKIFAFTSNSEGFPNVLGEAMSHGLATITYDFIAGASDLIINNHNGILIELNNQISFKNKLVELINNEYLICKLGINAIESIKKYDINLIANRYLEMLLKDEKH